MSNASNLYAEKVFGEHPIALWPLDETVDYISLISDNDRDFSNNSIWANNSGSIVEDYSLISPIENSAVYKITSGVNQSFLVSASELVTEYINKELESVTISFHFYPYSTNIASVDVGYKYDGNGIPRHTDSQEYSENFVISDYGKWQHISKTFQLPSEEITSIAFDSNNLIVVNAIPTKISLANHGFSNGDRFKIDAEYDMPAGLNKYNIYYVANATTNTFELEESSGSGGLQFTYPQFGNLQLISVKTITPFIKYNLYSASQSRSYVSGLSIGQWSAEFSESSFGTSIEEISGINLPQQYYAVRSDSYGLQDLPAYYLARENKLLAKNENMPMVYGSSSLTSLLPERFGGPSLIIPGNGCLNEAGRYKTYTVEMWLRLSPDTKEPKRIFGPINSTDGLYVDGPFLTLKVGDAIGAHYIGEWYRPMLVNVIIFSNGASLIINGEKVIDLSFSTADLILPEKQSLAGKDQDWLGFYSYSDIRQYEVDCVAIYSYRVPGAVSKRRWVYGQAIEFPENIASSYSGKSFPIDYTFSRYSNNYIYPDTVRWRQGISENISSNSNVLRPPDYSLPDIVFNNKTTDSWTQSLANNYSDSITLKPDDSWVDTDGYIFFNKADILEQKTSGFYSVFEAPIGYNSTQTLFRLENQVTGNYLDVDLHTENKNVSFPGGTAVTSVGHGLNNNDIIIFSGILPSELILAKEYFVKKINNDSFEITEFKDGATISMSEKNDPAQFIAHVIRYKILFNSTTESLVYQTPAITLGYSFVAGINFSQFASYFGGNASTLVGNRGQLKLYVGGNKNFNKTFTGSIYRIGFCTQRNINKLNYLFDSNGTPFLRYQFDGNGVVYSSGEPAVTANAGYLYEDYIDDISSHVASYTLVLKSFFGTRYLDIATSSYWQDYAPLTYFAKTITNPNGSKSYGLDFIQYNSDTTIPSSFSDGNYDTSNLQTKTHVSFQMITSGSTTTDDLFTNTEFLPASRIVSPGSDWLTTKYEVINGTIIYPPAGVNINDLSIVVHVDMSSKGIIKNPIRVRSLQLAGKALNSLSVNPIQTRFGISMYPYKKYGLYYDYKAQNPYLMYKDSTPHLYLTKHSGIELTGDSFSSDRGISLPVNRERSDNYKLSTVQFSMRFTRSDAVTEPTEIMQIDSSSSEDMIKIWIEPSIPSDKRFRLYATNKNNVLDKSVIFYINGRSSSNPVFSIYDWNMIAIALKETIDIGGKSGRINFVGPIMFNNVSYYALNSLQAANLAILGESEYVGIDPSVIYGIFTGTNKVILGDNVALSPLSYQYSFLNDLTIQSATVKPV